MKKDDMLEITIEDISSDGSGVGKADGFALFVKDTIPGDQVKVKIMKMKKRYGYARLMEILVPSPDRIQAPCPVARQCGGCQIQQMSYERQLTFKENKVCNNLRRLGGLDLSAMEVEPICGMEEPFHYRNKAQFPIGRDKNGKIIAGFTPKKVLVHFGGQSARKSGLLDRVEKALEAEGIAYVELGV